MIRGIHHVYIYIYIYIYIYQVYNNFRSDKINNATYPGSQLPVVVVANYLVRTTDLYVAPDADDSVQIVAYISEPRRTYIYIYILLLIYSVRTTGTNHHPIHPISLKPQVRPTPIDCLSLFHKRQIKVVPKVYLG